jgi:hypothetical protein
MHLAGGAAIFGGFLLVYFAVIVYTLYTRRGSGINQRPWMNPYGDSPGATGASTMAHDADITTRWTRGTRP